MIGGIAAENAPWTIVIRHGNVGGLRSVHRGGVLICAVVCAAFFRVSTGPEAYEIHFIRRAVEARMRLMQG